MEVLYVRYRILISDDEVDIVEMLTGFFRSKGYEVFSAYNGVETLKLAELQPDIILLPQKEKKSTKFRASVLVRMIILLSRFLLLNLKPECKHI